VRATDDTRPRDDLPSLHGDTLVSPILDISELDHMDDHRDVTGEVRFYDDATAWGVILGSDGALYGVRGRQVPGPSLRVGEQVTFDPQPGDGGPRATAVRRLRPPAAARDRRGSS
jgi:cold shock CspA family protein